MESNDSLIIFEVRVCKFSVVLFGLTLLWMTHQCRNACKSALHYEMHYEYLISYVHKKVSC